MKKILKNMNLVELLEFDKNYPILSAIEYCRLYGIDKLDKYDYYRKRQPIRKELDRLYLKLLKELNNEINKSNFDKDTITIIILVTTLINNSLLSITDYFDCKEKYIKYDFGYQKYEIEGSYIPAGYGTCRHINSFVGDLLAERNIQSDKIVCFSGTEEEYIRQQLYQKTNFKMNHLIIGYIENNFYYLVDPKNGYYTIKKYTDFYQNLDYHIYIPDFSDNLFWSKLNWNPSIPYQEIDYQETLEKSNQIQTLLKNGEINRFIEFKNKNYDLLKKIAYLAPLELERNEVQEHIKIKSH